jgi:hypothetical protein
MTPERAFLVWLSTRQFMIVKKHRDELRAHLVKALQASEASP